MKFIFAFVSALAAISQTSALVLSRDNATDSAEDKVAATLAACSNPGATLSLLRAWKSSVGDHFYTTDAAEMVTATKQYGYAVEGTTGYLFTSPQVGNIAFYRLWQPDVQDHLYTTSVQERDNAVRQYGYTFEKIAGYCYPDPSCGGLPLYRSWNPSSRDHFYTMSEVEKNDAHGAGWVDEGVACYMYPF